MKNSLSKFAFNSIKWSGFSQFGRQGFQIITSIILARLLLPEDFGLVGMAFIIIGFLNILKDLGTSAAIIQKGDVEDKLLSSVFWLNIIFGISVTALLIILSKYICILFNDNRVGPILNVLSFSFFITSLGNVHQAILEKSLQFKKLAKIEILATSIGSLLGIMSALWGFKVWSLVIQSLSTILINSILLWYFERWHPHYFIKYSRVEITI